ncbi:hypothetical protein VNI00_019396 [Paramarasmius palmivorus]|uniref:Uncharacterized protein n=1 Tax=Paramarasmius palmivorus TaxID=297713 RepID=A0AAW0ALN6_9AGAR
MDSPANLVKIQTSGDNLEVTVIVGFSSSPETVNIHYEVADPVQANLTVKFSGSKQHSDAPSLSLKCKSASVPTTNSPMQKKTRLDVSLELGNDSMVLESEKTLVVKDVCGYCSEMEKERQAGQRKHRYCPRHDFPEPRSPRTPAKRKGLRHYAHAFTYRNDEPEPINTEAAASDNQGMEMGPNSEAESSVSG